MAEIDYMSEAKATFPIILELGFEEKLVLANAIADLLSILTTYHDMIDDEAERDRIRKYIAELIYKWLEIIAPIQYVPGLLDELSNLVRKPFTEIYSVLSEDFMAETITLTVVAKEKAFKSSEDEARIYSIYLENRARALLNALHGGKVNFNKYRVLRRIFGLPDGSEKIPYMITVIIQSVILSIHKS